MSIFDFLIKVHAMFLPIIPFFITKQCTPHISLFFVPKYNGFSSLFEGKLKKWDTVDEVHKSIDIPEAPKKNGSGAPGNIPLPPPPPPGGLAGMAALSNLMKPFSKSAQRAESPDSSVYSPGTRHLLCTYFQITSFVINNICHEP